MGKSRAEIQKAYRERRKLLEGNAYKEKESKRVLKYYVPSAELSTGKRAQRNAVAAERNRKHRRRMKQNQVQLVKSENPESSSGYESQERNATLKVKMSFNNRKNKRNKRNTQLKVKKQIQQLETEKISLMRKCKAKQKVIERLTHKINHLDTNPNGTTNINMTPRRKTALNIRQLQLTPRRADRIRKPLLLAHSVTEELSERQKPLSDRKKHKKGLLLQIATKIALKYKCMNFLSKETGIHRKVIERIAKQKRKTTRLTKVQRLREQVEAFYCREDNCRTQPGKKDSKKCPDGKERQIKILTDFIENLHRKFSAENPECKISLTSFGRMRPSHVLKAQYLSRQACLCVKHQNMSCRSVDEIQSAYWHQTTVTIHPVVVYFRESGDKLKHKSLVIVSDEMSHASSTVWSIIDLIVPEIQVLKPCVARVHFWTDSPTSQYRNKHIFHVVANFQNLYNTKATWNYFEAGHGKGPCDGLGGTTKRMADAAVRNGSAVIQDAQDFLAWAVSSTMKEVKFLWLSQADCQRKRDVVSTLTVKAIKGTMKVHAVTANSNELLLMKDTSCYCESCLNGDICNTWSKQAIEEKEQSSIPEQPASAELLESGETQDDNSSVENTSQTETSLTVPIPLHDIEVDEFVACVYDNSWYIGQVIDVNEHDINVNFMSQTRSLFKWPHPADMIWVMKTNVLCKVATPVATGKSNRLFKISATDREMVEIHFSTYTDNK